jgi:hypothetical protein
VKDQSQIPVSWIELSLTLWLKEQEAVVAAMVDRVD